MANDTNLQVDRAQAERMLRGLLPNLPIWLFAIDPSNGKIISRKFAADQFGQLLTWIKEVNNRRLNIYFSVNELTPNFCGKKAKKTDVININALHVDVDVLDASTLNSIKNFEPRPSLIICSGGGYQAFWLLEGPTLEFERVEAINKSIASKLGGDNCHNIDRIMRVAGTINWPSPSKIAAGRTPVMAYIVEDGDDA